MDQKIMKKKFGIFDCAFFIFLHTCNILVIFGDV
jgi:hypothetical protein